MTDQCASHRLPYRFGDFVLDPGSRELRRAGELLSTSPKVFDCIAYLIEQRDRAVSRDELIAAVWGKVDVAYSLLGQLMAKVRRTIGRAGNDQDMIRTIPRFGYRWIAALDGDENDAEAPEANCPAPVPVGHASNQTRRSFRVPTMWTCAVLLAIATGAGAWICMPRMHTALTALDAGDRAMDAVAILPVNVNAAGQWPWVRLGLMDLIGERLRRAGQPVVPSENIVALARGDDEDRLGDSIRDATGARHVVVPTASRGQTEWRVRLRLETVNSSDETFEAASDDLVEAAREASDRLLVRLGHIATTALDDPIGSEDELLARAKAALLSNDVDAARQILESAPAEIRQSAEVRRRLAQADYLSGRLQSASDRLLQLTSELGVESNPRQRAAALNDYGVVAVYLDEPLQAQRRFAESLLILAGEDHPFELGRAHLGLATAFAMQDDADRSSAEFSRARIAFGVTGDAVALATIEFDEGSLEIARDHFAAAQPVVDRAAARFEHLGMRDELLHAQATRIAIALALLEPARALTIGTLALPLLATAQNRQTRHDFQVQWARALVAVGRLTDARSVFEEIARDTPRDQESTMLPATVAAYQSTLEFDVGDFDTARTLSTRAVEVLTLPDFLRDRSEAWATRVRTLGKLGLHVEAASESERFSTWAVRTGHPAERVLANAIAAEVAPNRDKAVELYEFALREALAAGVPADLGEVVSSYGDALISGGDLDRASAVIGLVTRFSADDFASAVLLARLHRALGRRAQWQANLEQARALAGERPIPADALVPPDERLTGGPSP